MEKIIYVAPSPNGRCNGTKAHPYTSVEQARDAARLLRGEGQVVRVILQAGTYSVRDTLVFTAEDSGSPESPVVYEGKGEVIFEGGAVLDAAAFTPVSGEAKDRIKSDAAKQSALQYDLRGAGLIDTDKSNTLELFIGDRRGVLARYPSDDFLRAPEGLDQDTMIPDVWHIVSTWKTTEHIRIQGYYPIDYWRNEADVLRYDAESGKFELSTNELRSGFPFIFYNVLEELSEPGEYYIDCNSGMLYVIPTDDFDAARITVSQLDGPVISIDSAENIIFRGLTVQGSRGAGVLGKGNRITFDGCHIRNVRAEGIGLEGCGHSVINCHIHTIGGCGIRVSGGDCTTLKPARITVDNNHIHHYSERSGTYNAGVSCSNFIEAGFVISHNCIHDSIHNAIMVASGDTFVEYNEIYSVCTEANDAGAIYFGRWEIQNLVFRYNYIHDIYNRYGFGRPHAIYNDDGGSGKVAYGNVIEHVSGHGFAYGGGNNNLMYNNILIDCNDAVMYDSRQYYGGWEHAWSQFPDGMDWRFLYNNKSFLSRSWVGRYSRMTTIKYTQVENREDRFVAGAVATAAFYGNLEVACRYNRNIEPATEKFLIQRDNAVYPSTAGVGFVDYESHNLNLRPDSRVWRDLPFFTAIPFDEIGLRTATERNSK